MFKEGSLSNSKQIPYLLSLLRIPGLGASSLMRLFNSGLLPEILFSLGPDELRQQGLSEVAITAMANPCWQAVEKDLTWLEQDRNFLLTIDSCRYPDLLRQIHAPPPALFVRGNPAVLLSPQLAIVGSRHPSADGRRLGLNFAASLAAMGITITSGLAVGIDSYAHQGALQADSLTIAILGNGLGSIYPARNRKLAEAILKRGALVSEFPLDFRPVPSNFPRRNRLISGMSMGVLVVEAALKSGSLITARYANEQGREVFAIPGSIHNPMTRGCHSLIRDGAKLVEQIQDITEELQPMVALLGKSFAGTVAESQSTKGLDAKTKLLLDSIGYQAVDIDTLIEETGIAPGQLASSLLNLELEGWIESLPGSSYKRRA